MPSTVLLFPRSLLLRRVLSEHAHRVDPVCSSAKELPKPHFSQGLYWSKVVFLIGVCRDLQGFSRGGFMRVVGLTASRDQKGIGGCAFTVLTLRIVLSTVGLLPSGD